MAKNHEIETFKHKLLVFRYAGGFALRLLWRALVHDASKLRSDEATGFQRILDVLENHAYGSEEYNQALSTGCIRLHYTRNPHHPEHYERGINGMSLLDIVEMICDWRAAIRRSPNGNLAKSLMINRGRFGVCSLWDVLDNEAHRLGAKDEDE